MCVSYVVTIYDNVGIIYVCIHVDDDTWNQAGQGAVDVLFKRGGGYCKLHSG